MEKAESCKTLTDSHNQELIAKGQRFADELYGDFVSLFNNFIVAGGAKEFKQVGVTRFTTMDHYKFEFKVPKPGGDGSLSLEVSITDHK